MCHRHIFRQSVYTSPSEAASEINFDKRRIKMDRNFNDHTAKTPVRAVIFDLDGTLLYTLENLHESTNYALNAYNLPARTLEETRSFVGNGVRKLLERAVYCRTSDSNKIQNSVYNPSPNTKLSKILTDEEFEDSLALFKEHYAKTMYEKTRPYEGIMDLLKELNARNIKCAVVSNKFDAAVKELCDRYFDGLICCAIGEGSGIRKKPAPDGVFKAIEAINNTGAASEQTLSTQSDGSHASPSGETGGIVYVGDSEVDIETARNAGLPCISVSWGYKDRGFLISHGAKTIVDTPQELAQILTGNF